MPGNTFCCLRRQVGWGWLGPCRAVCLPGCGGAAGRGAPARRSPAGPRLDIQPGELSALRRATPRPSGPSPIQVPLRFFPAKHSAHFSSNANTFHTHCTALSSSWLADCQSDPWRADRSEGEVGFPPVGVVSRLAHTHTRTDALAAPRGKPSADGLIGRLG